MIFTGHHPTQQNRCSSHMHMEYSYRSYGWVIKQVSKSIAFLLSYIIFLHYSMGLSLIYLHSALCCSNEKTDENAFLREKCTYYLVSKLKNIILIGQKHAHHGISWIRPLNILLTVSTLLCQAQYNVR